MNGADHPALGEVLTRAPNKGVEQTAEIPGVDVWRDADGRWHGKHTATGNEIIANSWIELEVIATYHATWGAEGGQYVIRRTVRRGTRAVVTETARGRARDTEAVWTSIASE